MIDAKNYTQRRKKLAELAENPLIVITGSDLVQKSSDETYDFEQDGYFYYLTGIEEPGWILVINSHKGEEILISTDESSYHNSLWEVKNDNQEIAELSGVKLILNRRDGWEYLRREAQNFQSIGSIVPKMRFSRPFGMYINPAKTMLVERLRRLHKDTNLVDISADIRSLRSVKDPDEIEELRKAIATTKLGFDDFLSRFDTYTNESEIYNDLTHTFMVNGSNHGYKPVIASGSNTAVLHYKNNNQPIVRNDFLLMDVGALSGRYTADITRTYEVGTVSQRHKDIWQATSEAQAESLSFLGPGVSMRDHEMHIEQFIGKKLNQLGIINTMLRQDIRAHYPHAIAHHLGIDVHDSCDYEAPLKPGAVITVEPGIYTQEEGIGVRLEEDILITDNGVEILTKGIGER